MRGEWWIDERGDITFADGDIGDSNHAGLALQHARRELLSSMGQEVDEDWICDTILRDQIEAWMKEDLEMTQEQCDDADNDLIKSHAKELGIEPHLVDAAFDRWSRSGGREDTIVGVGDIREYALRYWRWKWVKQDQIGTWFAHDEDLRIISKGINNIAEDEGLEEGSDTEKVWRETDIWIAVGSTSHTHVTTLGDLLDYNYDGLQRDPSFTAPRIAQVAKAEKALQHPYYRDKHEGG